MAVSIYDTHEELSISAAQRLVKRINDVLSMQACCIFVPSAGRTPTRIYEILAEKHMATVNWNRVLVVQMDEYANVEYCSSGSFSEYLVKKLVEPLGIGEFCSFFGSNGKLTHDLGAIDNKLSSLGGIDTVLYGIGENGHLGFNEPGSCRFSHTRKVRLTKSTLIANQRAISDYDDLSAMGVTLGLDVLLKAKSSLLIASGDRKLKAINLFLMGMVSNECPASHLRTVKNVDVLINSDCYPSHD